MEKIEMTSERQVVANQKNSKCSTGARSPFGKQVSKLNATKFGMTAKTLCLPWEDPKALEASRREYHRYHKPKGRPEKDIVDRIVDIQWRLLRVERAERAILEYHKNSEDWKETTYALRAVDQLEEKKLVSFPNHGPVQSGMYDTLAGRAYPIYMELTAGVSCLGKAHIDAASDLAQVARHETTLWRNLRAARQELRQLQEERRKREKSGCKD